MSEVRFGRIVSEYPWVKTVVWGKPEGMIASLEIDGHRLEIHKKPFLYPEGHVKAYQNHTRPPNTFRFWLVVDGRVRGSKSPRISQILSEADAMVAWGKAATALAQAEAE